MKKNILVLFLIIFIIPSIALASWWNPFSWKIFQKKEVTPQVQVEVQKTPEEKISELQKQVDDLKNQQQDSTVATETSIESVPKIVSKKVSDLTDSEIWEQYSTGLQKNIAIPNYSERIRIATIVCNYIETIMKPSESWFKIDNYPYCSEGKTKYVFIKSHLKDIQDSRNSKKDTLSAWEKILGFRSYDGMGELNDYVKNEPASSTASKQNSEINKPANTSLCNGKYWGNCTTGKQFYCPTTGDPSCVDPNTSTLCNGKYWNNCTGGKQFYCPASGDAQCNTSTAEIEALLKQIQQNTLINNQNTLNTKLRLEELAREAETARVNAEIIKLKNQIEQSQNTQPTVQLPSINCSNYQTEKNTLDEYYASNGTLFSGARVNATNALNAKYASCF